MKQFCGTATRHIDATPADVFDLLTDVARLPRWNTAIERVVDDPGPLGRGAQWTVRMHPPHLPSWGSTSTAEVVDPDGLAFAYRTQNTDGNPSWVDWSWTIHPAADGSEVTVEWTCHLETIDRRLLAGPIRKRGLAREVPASLDALAAVLTAAPTSSAAPGATNRGTSLRGWPSAS